MNITSTATIMNEASEVFLFHFFYLQFFGSLSQNFFLHRTKLDFEENVYFLVSVFITNVNFQTLSLIRACNNFILVH